MPWITHSAYRPPFWLPGGHLQTIWPALFRRCKLVTTQAERLELDDGDFLDLAWSSPGESDRVAILCHGLEGSFIAPYIQGMARALYSRGWTVVAWNYRGCGSVQNRHATFYHSGKTEDLAQVVGYVLERLPRATVDLVGFSLGGNLLLKYLGESVTQLPRNIGRVVAISAPCDLSSCARMLKKKRNYMYSNRFLSSLRRKIRKKSELFPDSIDLQLLKGLKSLNDFDERYTAPLHGFESAEDYWRRSSSKQFLGSIRSEALLVNAVNDPILGSECYPVEEAKQSAYFHFEMPLGGGHLGFGGGVENWIERRTVEFLMYGRKD